MSDAASHRVAVELGARRERPLRARPRTDRLAAIVFALLVVACFAAFFVTQRLKHSPTAVQRFELTPRFVPTAGGPLSQERISFKIARADEVTVTIVNSSGDTVATLVRDHPVPRYKQVSLRWNGREGAAVGYALSHTPDGTPILTAFNRGRLAPEGEYRVRVALRAQHRELLSPRTFELQRE
ncbi:MAG TPA: hypothetical protein VEJ23_02040 [Solirubrobacteraceae bacterium]|nr:hypothetical protein [Solirubrobacteraceae bacterium]